VSTLGGYNDDQPDLVPDSLLITSNPLNSQVSIFLGQPSGIHLIVRHNKQEHNANGSCQQPNGQEHDLPRCDRSTVFGDSGSDAVRE